MQVASPQNGGKDKRDCGLCDRGRVASVICKSVGGRHLACKLDFRPALILNFLTLVETACEKIKFQEVASYFVGSFIPFSCLAHVPIFVPLALLRS